MDRHRIRHAAAIAACALGLLSARTAWSDSNDAGSQRLIGMAAMKPDGTIVLDLHSGPEGHYAMGHLEYPPTHKDYQMILDHLGGLKPGERKGVAPWPDRP